MTTTDNINAHFLQAMRQAGLEPDCTIVADGKLHRFRDWLDKPGTQDGWYVLFADGPPAGAFGHWRLGISERWCFYGRGNGGVARGPQKQIEQYLNSEHQLGKVHAESLWAQAVPANGQHSYLKAKIVKSYGLRYLPPSLLVPVQDVTGCLHGVQRIFPNGDKRFTRFTNKFGHFYLIGKPVGSVLYFAEGYATAATIHEITGQTTIVVFDAGNLLPVAMNLRKHYPHHDFVICGDDDRFHEHNPGRTKALEVADASGAKVVFPRFTDPSSRVSDFNDLFIEEGANSVLACLLQKGGADVSSV